MIPIQPPPDGFTGLEKIFIKQILVSVYKKLLTDKDRFIVVSYFECGYSQEEIGKILGISQEAVNKRIKKCQEYLRKNKKLLLGE